MPADELAAVVPLVHGGADSSAYHRIWRLNRLQHAFGYSLLHMENDLLIASIIEFMSNDFALALAYLNWKKSLQTERIGGAIEDMVRSLWEYLFDDTTFCMRCVLELCDGSSRARTVADRWVMESMLVRDIMQAGLRGVVMNLNRIIEVFLGLWFQRDSTPPLLQSWLCRLAYHENSRRKFGVRLRTVWNLHIGSYRVVTITEPDLARQKVRA